VTATVVAWATDGNQLIQLALQTSEEQQGEQTELGNRLQVVEGFIIDLLHLIGADFGQSTHQLEHLVVDLAVELRRQDQMQTRDADQNAGDQLAEDSG
jgi:hypothetical protein